MQYILILLMLPCFRYSLLLTHHSVFFYKVVKISFVWAHMWILGDNLRESVFSFHHVGPESRSQAIKLTPWSFCIGFETIFENKEFTSPQTHCFMPSSQVFAMHQAVPQQRSGPAIHYITMSGLTKVSQGSSQNFWQTFFSPFNWLMTDNSNYRLAHVVT